MFYADLHIHSRFSRATSPDGTLESLACWARQKGLGVLGTGDFTHPGWMADIKSKLIPAEAGLFRLKPALEKQLAKAQLPCRNAAEAPIQFILQVEIATIYKQDGKTRKVHHLVFMPSLDAADRFIQKLERIGNLKSDGRPILGLNSRNLLETALEADRDSLLIPAHIWTPWFSVLGSKSGFDRIADCYGDLAPHIFALETGLSSDPMMNWQLSQLDRYRLVSNSDAHSPSKLGRESCVFESAANYFAMRDALATGVGYGGTIEFFPEEGKYHMDGHRKCNQCLTPAESRKHHDICPICNKPLTIGVMHRVAELADRPEGTRPAGAADFRYLIPLTEIIGETLCVGQASRKVEELRQQLISTIGPELFILQIAPIDAIKRAGFTLVAEAIKRMREGKVIREAGYDGEYGIIRLFKNNELKSRPPKHIRAPEKPAKQKNKNRLTSATLSGKTNQLDLF